MRPDDTQPSKSGPVDGDAGATGPAAASHTEALAARGSLRSFRRGTILIQEGDRGDTLYIVRSGRLRAYAADANGKEITLGIYGAGEYVGEMSLDGGPRSANVETLEATTCAVVTREALLAYIAERPDFALVMMARLIRRARLATESTRNLALIDVYGRMARLLEQLAGPPGRRRQPHHRRAIDAPPDCRPPGLLARDDQPADEGPGDRRLCGGARAPDRAAEGFAGALVRRAMRQRRPIPKRGCVTPIGLGMAA